MKKTTRKLIAGTLLCTMAFSGMTALTYGDETFSYVHAAETDDYAPYEEAIYLSKENRFVEDKIQVSAGVEENLYPAVALF